MDKYEGIGPQNKRRKEKKQGKKRIEGKKQG